MMDRPRWPAPVLPSALAVALAIGCGEGRPSVDRSTVEAQVSGVVKLKGKAVSGGQIAFNPSNVERQTGEIRAQIGPDGTYAIKTLTGQNAVRFSGPFLAGRPDLAMRTRVVEVAQGDNVRDFDILGEGDPAQGPTYPARTRSKGQARR